MSDIRNRKEILQKMNARLKDENASEADFLAAELLTFAYSMASKAKEAEDMFFEFAETFALHLGIIPVPDFEDEVID